MEDTERRLKAKLPGADTGIEIRKSVCTICDPMTQCGLDLYVRDGRVVKVEGTRENPTNRGTLCAKGAATRQYVYHEDRLLTPLRRTGPRGSGEYEPIGWDEALEEVVANLERVKAESGPESAVFYVGYPKHMRPFVQRLALQYGSPNFCTESSSCFTATAMAFRLVYGQMAGPDLRNARCALVWSGNPFHSRTPAAGPLMDVVDRGTKLIVVDPRRTQLASKATIHLQLRPGTDGALALGIAHVILEEGLHDAGFVAAHTKGFAEYRAYVRQFDPERVESITGVPAEKIRAAAQAVRDDQAGGADVQRGAGRPPRQRRAELARRVRAHRPHRQLRRGRRQPAGAVQLAGDRRRRLHHAAARVRAAAELGRPAAAGRLRPLPGLGGTRRPGPGHGPAAADPHRRPVPAARPGRLRPQPPHVPGAGPLSRGHPAARLHLRRRPLRHRLLALRRHRAARLQLGGAQRAALLPGEVDRADRAGDRAARGGQVGHRHRLRPGPAARAGRPAAQPGAGRRS